MQNALINRSLVAIGTCLVLSITSVSFAQVRSQNPRLVILTDMGNEPDDSQTMVHLLMYANEIDIEGLIAVTSRWLNPTRKPPKNRTYPELIVERVKDYGKVRDNLVEHASGWPTEEYLLSRVAAETDETVILTLDAGGYFVGTASSAQVVIANYFRVPAFPGAEGFGKWSQGGRGGDVYIVSNLNDSGPGSLREAVEASGPRTIVFEVSGTIFLNGKLRITNPYITIAGQTAPGDGICIAECPLIIEAEHSIIRYMRCRLGDNVDSGDGDTISIRNDNVIIDHCSASWSVDEVLSTYMDPSDSSWPDKVTVQWTIVAEALRNSDIKSEPHSMGSLLRGSYGSRYSFHHNLYLHNATRNPRPGNDTPGDEDSEGLILDWRNNVVYNWKGKSAGANYDGTEYSKYNFINNYYVEGPNSGGDDAFSEDCPYAEQYFAGNYMNGVLPGNPWSLVGGSESGGRLSSPIPVESVTTETAPEAYASVLAHAGASHVRDAVDTRLINDVINGTGAIIDDEQDVGGWPTLNSTTPPADTDRDGMPDDWELARGLNPNDPSDRNGDRLGDGYSNLEEYINGIPYGPPPPHDIEPAKKRERLELPTDDEWWLRPHRLIQTNLREIDAMMDLDRYMRDIKDFGADVVLFNVGGIVANYPTDLEFHWRNTYMKGDMVASVLERLHAEGIRMIGRFDFSKINEKFAAQHPDWLYVSESGQNVNYNGQVHTCVSGGYQQEYMFKILGEAVDRYPLDGVFFNMIGYQRSDYSGNYHGICQCENCRRLFKEHCGLELPARVEQNNPTYRKYLQFTRNMTDRQFKRVNAFLKSKRSHLGICTYTKEGIDIIRKESNSALGRGTYIDTHKAKKTLLEAGRRQLANAAVHFFAIPFRHASVAPHLTGRRLFQQMINGAWLDFYCIGPLHRQEDRLGLDIVRDIYRFHAANESYLINTKPAAQVALFARENNEYMGMLNILCENQIPFELVHLDLPQLKEYEIVIVPDADGLNDQQTRVLDRYVEQGGKVLITGKIPAQLQCFNSLQYKSTRPTEKGSYIRIRPEDRERLERDVLEKLDLVFLNGVFHVYESDKQTDNLLRLIPGDMFGPPEKCYYRNVSDVPALFYRKHGKGSAAYFPWEIASHYQRQCHQGHANLVLGAMENLLGLNHKLRVESHPLVEVTHRQDKDNRFEWVALYNHSGQRENALHRPIPMYEIKIHLRPARPLKAVRLLKAEEQPAFSCTADDKITITIPQLNHYEIALFEYKRR